MQAFIRLEFSSFLQRIDDRREAGTAWRRAATNRSHATGRQPGSGTTTQWPEGWRRGTGCAEQTIRPLNEAHGANFISGSTAR
jgi:hypothetical protein